MLDTTQRAAEGWYPDPHGGLCLRHWDGEHWTHETRAGTGFGAGAPGFEGLVDPTNAPPPETGWGAVAIALRSALISGEPVRVTVALPDRTVLTVNTFDHSYTWLDEPDDLPRDVDGARIGFARSELTSAGQGRSLDGLLWRISMTAFPDRAAPWLQPDDLYRMQRWPNLTTINPELDDMRQAAMLANGMFTVEELAGFSDRRLQPTRSLINALSLMNTLKVAAPRETNVFAPAVPAGGTAHAHAHAPARRIGLFQRLRDRLGL